MKLKALGLIALVVSVGISLLGWQNATEGRFDAASLKKALEDIGYEAKVLEKEPGKEKYEIKVERGELNIPIAIEISGSKNFVWLTALLQTDFTDAKPASKLIGLLKANHKIQPSQFYVTSRDRLMAAIAMENRAITNAILRRNVDKLATDIVEQKAAWQ